MTRNPPSYLIKAKCLLNRATGVIFAIAIYALGANTSLAESFYKWVDDNGVTHYTTSPPKNENITATIITATGLTVASDEAQRANERLKASRDGFTAGATDRALDVGSDGDDSERTKLYASYCKDAQRNLKLLSENARVRQKDPESGEMVVIPEENHNAQKDEARKQIKEFCK